MRLISRLNWWQWGQLTDYIGIRTSGIPKLQLSCRSALGDFCPMVGLKVLGQTFLNEVDWEGNANRIGLQKTEVFTSACASRFHSQVSRSPLKVCLHWDSDSIFPAFLRSACEMDSFIGGCYFTHWSWEILLHLPLELRSQEKSWPDYRTSGQCC